MNLLPPDITTLTACKLDQLRSSIGAQKLSIRRASMEGGAMSKETLAKLRPFNDAIDRINAEEVRREEDGYQRRLKIKAERKCQPPAKPPIN